MHVVINGKRWEYSEVPYLGKDENGDKYKGHCDAPNVKNKTIKVLKSLNGREKLDVLIHEALHAGLWHIDEEYVEMLGTDLARFIDRVNSEYGIYEEE